ncbi:MAG: hypothetical protein JWP41_3501 [Ramlibacter sp.]|nr:hypothetical protein [Ramlibacter sp.]
MKQPSRAALIGLYVVSVFPGLARVSQSFSAFVVDTWEDTLSSSRLYPWAGIPAEPKIQSLVEYVLLTVMLGLVLAFAFLYHARHRAPLIMTRAQKVAVCAYLLLCFLLPLGFEKAGPAAVWFLVAAALPAYAVHYSTLSSVGPLAEGGPRRSWYREACAVALVALLVALYATAWSPKLRFMNEYAELPEQTRLDSGKWVDNSTFLREQAIPGHYAADPCKGEVVQGLCVTIPRNAFDSITQPFDLFPSGSGLHYSWEDEKLRTYRKPTEEECLLISALMNSPEQLCTGLNARKVTASFSAETQEYYLKNKQELRAQTELGRFFFHHAYLYLPVLHLFNAERGAGADTAKLPMQYGTGLSQTFAKVLEWTGSASFQHYFTLYWVGPGLYAVLTALAVFVITGRVNLALAACAFVIALLPFQTTEALRMAPGFNPWRHLPDLACFVAVAINTRRPGLASALLRAAALGLMFWWNREFGLFMLAASGAWHVMSAIQRGRVSPIGGWLLELAAAGLVFVLGDSGPASALTFYNLIGVGAPITNWSQVQLYAVLWLLLLGWVAWMRFARNAVNSPKQAAELDVAGVGICYAACATVYGLWNPSPQHFSVVWICAAVPLAALLDWSIDRWHGLLEVPPDWTRRYLTIALCTYAVLASVTAMWRTEQQFSTLFTQHKAHEWRLPGLVGVSTGDSAPLVESLALIEKVQPAGGVVLLSRFDVLLLTASQRGSRLPFVDVPSALIGWPLVHAMQQQISALKPAVIFMDTDVRASREWQMMDEDWNKERSPTMRSLYKSGGSGAFLHDQGLDSMAPDEQSPLYQRLGHLAAMGMLARLLSTCYAPAESGGLLQVWRRTCAG